MKKVNLKKSIKDAEDKRTKHYQGYRFQNNVKNWYLWLVIFLLLIAIIVYRVSFSIGFGTHRYK